MKPKVAFYVFNHTSVGGVERVTANLIALFIQNGIYVDSLLSLRDAKESNSMIKHPKDLHIQQIDWKDITNDLTHYLNKRKITHLIFQGDNMTISKSILKALHNTNCKGYLHYHGSPYAYLKKHLYWSDIKEKPINAIKIIIAKIFYPFKKRKLKQIIQQSSDGFVTVSNGVRLELKQLYKKDFPQVVTIHNPISYTEKTVVDLTTKENKIIFVSRLERKHKNAFLSIKAWQLIHEKYPDWEFQVLGDGRLFKEIKTFKKDNNITNLQLFGQVNNVNAYLEKSSISVLTSDCEGFGMGIFESIANKNAIVSTESDGGVKDLITDGFNGFIVPRNDIKQLSDKIEQLINDKELREKMANNSFERYQSLINENAFRQWKVLLNI